jgi:sulfide:quinone oxidoreductase
LPADPAAKARAGGDGPSATSPGDSVSPEAARLLDYRQYFDYDLLVSVPLHFGAKFLRGSAFAAEDGFVRIDPHTLEVKGQERVFAIGDATDAPTSKAGAVAHFQGEVLIENVLRAIRGEPALPAFDGHANCFIESGDGKAMLLDFNYTTEPLPGRFPLPGLGPFTLLEESHVNHWGKRAFRWVYWNLLLRGKELPLDHRMLMAGKHRPSAA